jgi:TRAP-type C4-dicarboxylate transport system permease small subunit
MSLLLAGIDAALRWLAIALLVVLLGTVTAGVISRGLGEPLIWTDEVSRFLMIWLACTGWVLASRGRAHIRIRFFADKLPAGARRGGELAIQAAMCGFGMLVAWHGWTLVGRSLELEATTVPIPMATMYVPVVLAGVATALQALSEIIEGVRPA